MAPNRKFQGSVTEGPCSGLHGCPRTPGSVWEILSLLELKMTWNTVDLSGLSLLINLLCYHSKGHTLELQSKH